MCNHGKELGKVHQLGLDPEADHKKQGCALGAQAQYGGWLERRELHCNDLDFQTTPPAKQTS